MPPLPVSSTHGHTSKRELPDDLAAELKPGKRNVTEAGKVNVNSASADELDAVGSLAGHGFEIVRYREERGRFTELRQLDEVPGLSGKVDADDLDRLTTGTA